MFTAQQINDAHAKVKTGADYPKYVKALKTMGVTRYEFLVASGRNVFHGSDGFQVPTEPKYAGLEVSTPPSAAHLQEALTIHQQGQTGFGEFCRQAANAGVEKWIADLDKMTCTYLDMQGRALIVESIPEAG